ncbi:MAG: type II secretion system protein [Vampirovibrio sp.]
MLYSINASIKKGFTLLELLVSLGVLGFIATITLPQIYISQDKIKKKAVFEEAYHAIATATQMASMDGVAITTDIIPYLNATKVCMTDSLAEGCVSASVTGTGDIDTFESHEAGVVLSTGVAIFGFNNGTASTELNCVDGRRSPGFGRNSCDGFAIGLEGFAKPEYFQLAFGVGDETVNINAMTAAINGESIFVKDKLAVIRPDENIFLRPGEVLCLDQACLNMLE